MTDTQLAQEFTITNSCECRFCPTCSIGTESEKCDECGVETEPMMDCDGFCYDYKLEWLDDMVKEYAKNNGHDYLVIHGSNMGWTRSSGYTQPIPATGEAVLEELTFRGDWTITFKLDENNLFTMHRSSHDEPTGATFYATPDNGEDY